jgi:hypothetical protein
VADPRQEEEVTGKPTKGQAGGTEATGRLVAPRWRQQSYLLSVSWVIDFPERLSIMK